MSRPIGCRRGTWCAKYNKKISVEFVSFEVKGCSRGLNPFRLALGAMHNINKERY